MFPFHAFKISGQRVRSNLLKNDLCLNVAQQQHQILRAVHHPPKHIFSLILGNELSVDCTKLGEGTSTQIC